VSSRRDAPAAYFECGGWRDLLLQNRRKGWRVLLAHDDAAADVCGDLGDVHA